MAKAESGSVSPAQQVLVIVGGLAAAAVARKIIQMTWVAATGKRPPEDPADPHVSTKDAVTFAVLSAAAMGAARLLVTRRVMRSVSSSNDDEAEA